VSAIGALRSPPPRSQSLGSSPGERGVYGTPVQHGPAPPSSRRMDAAPEGGSAYSATWSDVEVASLGSVNVALTVSLLSSTSAALAFAGFDESSELLGQATPSSTKYRG
jgi:hypothetical protein